jgi:hypothetical protein
MRKDNMVKGRIAKTEEREKGNRKEGNGEES